MGVYAEYLDRQLDFQALTAERKNQLKRIAHYRGGRDLLVYASDLNRRNSRVSISIDNSDLLPFYDQLSNLSGKSLDLIVETPGGLAEVVEQMVEVVRSRYEDVAIIVPGTAKSAGTIMAMSADDILMGPTSALGPIDAQLFWQGKVFSAEALLKGFKKIQEEVDKEKRLNLAHVPILQQISPGELQHAQNALNFAKVLVTRWLKQYKFKDWHTHSTTGQPVSDRERQTRAEEIAEKLCSHSEWLTHNRSIMIQHLREMKLRISDYSEKSELSDAIQRYYTLLQMTFATSSIYKIVETTTSQIFRFENSTVNLAQQNQQLIGAIIADVECPNCGAHKKIQLNLEVSKPVSDDAIPYPKDNKYKCQNCSHEIDLTNLKRQIELQTKKTVVP